MSWKKITLSNINNGEAVKLCDEAILEIIRNFQDPNTDIKKVRKISIDLEFQAKEKDPSQIKTNVYVKTKLAPKFGEEKIIAISHDDGGEIGMYENEDQGKLFKKIGNGKFAVNN